jgi:NADPH:quinone reductase-like Zn-dependent oxidoreductase
MGYGFAGIEQGKKPLSVVLCSVLHSPSKRLLLSCYFTCPPEDIIMTAMHKLLKDQIIVLTGASSGIGLATARLAAERGAKLVLVSRSANTLDHLRDEIVSAGGEAISIAADVADRAKMLLVAEEAVRHYGRVDT